MKKIFQVILHLCYYPIIIVALFYKTMYFHKVSGIYNLEPERDFLAISIIGCILILISVVLIISFNKTKWTILIVNIVVSVVILADIIYSKYYYNPLTVSVVFYQFKFLNDIKDSATALFDFQNLIIFADIPFLIIICLLIKEAKGKKWWAIKGFIAVIIFTIGFSFFKEAYINSDVSSFLWEKKNIARDLGVLYHHYDDIKSTAKRLTASSKLLTKSEKENIENNKYKKVVNEYTGIAKGKNLIILQLEAIQGFVINSKIEGQEITPNLNKLIKNNIYCDNLYFQANYGNTSDAEFIVNNSLYPSQTGAVYYEYPLNSYYSVANILNEQNYYTAAFHGYEAEFWNRVEMYRSLGFQKYYSKDDFKAEKIIGLGISDEEFFKQSLSYLMDNSGDNPFYGFMVALSSHHPYVYFNDSTLNVGEYEGTMLGNFLKGANYVDKAIGQMIEFMKEKGIYDDTVIAIYGDHAALFDDEAENLCKYLNIEYNDINWSMIQKVPLIISAPGIDEGIKISVPTGQIDILPTIANLMDIDIPYMYGRDILNNEYGYAILPRGNIVTEKFIFMMNEHNFYNIDTKQKLEETDELLEEARSYYRKKNISQTILERNALKKLLE